MEKSEQGIAMEMTPTHLKTKNNQWLSTRKYRGCMNIEEFTFDTRDEYVRKPIAERVVQLLASDARVSPMVIDGEWGTGKTEFCLKLKNLIEEIEEPDFKPVYIDAFKADHADEPIMTIMSSVIRLLPEVDRPPLIQKAIPALRFGLKTSLKAGVSWLLRQDAADIADDFSEELKTAGDEAINMAVESVLKDHIEADNSIKLLQEALKKIAEETPLVILIDELDRCRPDFAVNMLENIKHVFNVEGVQFVLITNLSQLKASINHCYGRNIQAQRYLDKFLGFSFTLPDSYKLNPQDSVKAAITHLENSLKNSEILSESCLTKEGSLEFIKNLVLTNDLSLREVETFVKYLEIYQILTERSGFASNLVFGSVLLRVMAVYLFCFRPNDANGYLYEYFSARAIADTLGINKLPTPDENENIYPRVEEVVVSMIAISQKEEMGDFHLDRDEKAMWTRIIREYFSGSHMYPDAHNLIRILRLAIDTMKLNLVK